MEVDASFGGKRIRRLVDSNWDLKSTNCVKWALKNTARNCLKTPNPARIYNLMWRDFLSFEFFFHHFTTTRRARVVIWYQNQKMNSNSTDSTGDRRVKFPNKGKINLLFVLLYKTSQLGAFKSLIKIIFVNFMNISPVLSPLRQILYSSRRYSNPSTRAFIGTFGRHSSFWRIFFPLSAILVNLFFIEHFINILCITEHLVNKMFT